MSYSISAIGATRAEALANVKAKFDEIIAAQPVHATDRDGAMAVAETFVGYLDDPAGEQEIYITLSGSLGWRGADAPKVFTHSNVSVNASVRQKT